MDVLEMKLWRDWGLIGVCEGIDWDVFEECAEERRIEGGVCTSDVSVGERREEKGALPWKAPEIRYKMVTTAQMKRRLTEICGSEEKLAKLKKIALPGNPWERTLGDREPDLSVKQQVEYLKFVLERLKDVSRLETSRGNGEWARYFWLRNLKERLLFEVA